MRSEKINVETMMENNERAQEALQLEALLVSRAYLYGLFHKLLGGAPDDELLDCLFAQMTFDALEEFGEASAQLQAFTALLAAKRHERADDPSGFASRAHDEYTRVLIGPGALPASPYESPYTGVHDMATFQANTLEVRRLYHVAGLMVRREQAVPDDHVALLCAFAHQMSTRALDALRLGDFAALADALRGQGLFVEAHLSGWLPVYAQSVRNSKAGAQAVLYPQLLEALGAIAAADAVFLAESAFWAESQSEGLEEVGRNRADAGCKVAASAELRQAQAALDALESLHPFGIQDNELVERRMQPEG